jgi:hypothetical protein
VDDGLPPHAVASKAAAAMTVMMPARDCVFMAASLAADRGEGITRRG